MVATLSCGDHRAAAPVAPGHPHRAIDASAS
jgi:hypothetical protein